MNYQNIIFKENKEKYEKCLLSKFKTEGRLISMNEKYLAMLWKDIGEIVIVNSSKPCIIHEDRPRIKGPKYNMLDLEFSPFDNHLLASTNDNNSVLLWKIPEEGINEDIINEKQIYKNHKNNKVNFVNFNPIDKDIILSSTYSGNIHIWNIIKNDSLNEFNNGNITSIESISWNPNGTLISFCANFKNINIFETRNNKIIFNFQINEMYKSSKFVWVDNNLLVTTSWNKNGEKMLKLWDIRKVNDDYSNQGEITSIIVDNSTNVSIPYINREQKFLYSIGKDEKYIKIYDYNGDKFYEINRYNSKFKSPYSVLCDRKCLDRKFEIDKFIRYNNANNELFFISVQDKRTDDSFKNERNILYNLSINKNEDINGKELREEIEKSKNNDNNYYYLIEENENNKKIIENLKNKIKEKDEIIKNNEESIKEKADYEQKIKSSMEMNKNLENQYNELNNKYNSLIKENDSNKYKIIQYEKIINDYKKQIDNIKSKNKEEKELYEKTIIKVLSQKYEEMIKQKLYKIEKNIKEKLDKLEKKKKPEKNESDIVDKKIKNVYNGAKCEKCFQEPIIGIRYKCSECNNYYLCSKCIQKNSETKGHPHKFNKFRKEEDMKKPLFNESLPDKNLIQLNQNLIQEKKQFSYECINILSLSTNIYEGTNDAKIEIILKNNGSITWPISSKIIIDNKSDLRANEIILKQQKPGEQQSYNANFGDLKNIKEGEYKSYLTIENNGNVFSGEKLILKIIIKKKKNEIEQNIDKIRDFRDNYALSTDDYSDGKLLEILKKNNFNFDKAFESLFN